MKKTVSTFPVKLLECTKKTEHAKPQQVNSRVFEAKKELLEKRRIMKREKTRNVEHSLFCKPIGGRGEGRR